MTQSPNNPSDFGSQSDNGPSDWAEDDPSAEEMRDELNDALGDLRRELAQLQVEEARDRVRNWIRENPLLALFLAAGAGLISGRVLAKALSPTPPPTLSDRARKQAQALRKRAERAASEVGHDVSERVARARREAERIGREAGETLSHRAQDWGDVATQRAAALRERAAKNLTEAAQAASKQSEDTAERVKASAEEATEAAKSWWSETARSAAKTAIIAFAAKKVGGWFRRKL